MYEIESTTKHSSNLYSSIIKTEYEVILQAEKLVC